MHEKIYYLKFYYLLVFKNAEAYSINISFDKFIDINLKFDSVCF